MDVIWKYGKAKIVYTITQNSFERQPIIKIDTRQTVPLKPYQTYNKNSYIYKYLYLLILGRIKLLKYLTNFIFFSVNIYTALTAVDLTKGQTVLRYLIIN